MSVQSGWSLMPSAELFLTNTVVMSGHKTVK